MNQTDNTKKNILSNFPSVKEIENIEEVKKVVYLKKSVKVFISGVTERRHNELLCHIGLTYGFAKYQLNYGYILFTM